MAHASFCNVFHRLPPSAAFLFLAWILRTAEGHALPRQTKTVEPHELNVVAWPPLPTDAPISPFELRRRQENTICGYIGGNSALPATCAPGSHCVLDTANGIVGCCPNGGVCTTGIFTGCVDGNSGPQTEINPYVYTCGGSDLYQNKLPWLNFELIHVVLDIFYYDDRHHINEFRKFINRLAYGGTFDRGYKRLANGCHSRGGTWRQVNGREGPGPAPAAPPRTEYTSPMRSHGAAFAPLPGWQEERQPTPSPYGNPYGNPYGQQHYESESTAYQPEDGVNYNMTPLGPPPRRYDPVHVPGVGTGLAPVDEEAPIENPTREIEDFSRAYADARIGQIPDEDQQPLTIPEERPGSGSESEHSRSPVRGGNRPLWQQNRQRSRNMMWM
ncbi:hypothetical protein DL764_010863 [Monosporascus ibericus]|uniref:Uncharacterized protein n=1 Tax=Monosporascus ibericus TaxID=155417 RepID=A0A4Q4STU5_9PEZI|nr:hypothetical protein DL764_010863 [Monosporascus ibericus]